MSKSARIREWMNGSVCAGVKFLYEKLPAHMVEHSLDLLEAHSREYSPKHTLDPKYLNQVVAVLIKYAQGDEIYMTTSKSDHYDFIHELNIYLDGWLFRIHIDKDIDPEKGNCCMCALPKS